MKNKVLVENKINELIKDFAFEGEVLLFDKDGLALSVGNLSEPILPMYKYDAAFVQILIIQLIEQKGYSFDQTIDLFFPELRHAAKITLMNLLRDNTGLVDIDGYLAKFHQNDKKYQALTDEQKMEFDANASLQRIADEKVINIYNQLDLEHKPGANLDYNSVTENLGVILLERAHQKPYSKLLLDLLASVDVKPSYFDHPVKRYINRYYNNKITWHLDEKNFIGITSIDAYKIYMALKECRLVSKKSLKQMQKLIEFNGIGFSDVYPFVHYFDFSRFGIYDFKEVDLVVVVTTLFAGYEKVIDGDNFSFEYKFMKQILPFILDYKSPKLIKLNKKNVYDLLHIENDEKQMWFMGSTKYSFAYQYVEDNVYCYLLVDHGLAVGTVTLHIDPKGDYFDISNVLIDKKYQNRGYGKALIKESLKVFAKHGAKSLTLYVNKDNPAAYKTYLSCGFIVKAVYPMSYEMIYKF